MMRWLAVALIGAAAGCATLEEPFTGNLASSAPPVRDCAQWYRDLDERVSAAGVSDAQAAKVAGFPYLRATRLLASLRDRAAESPAALEGLVDRMLAEDQRARGYELANLAAGADGVQRTRDCGRLLREVDFAKPASRQLLVDRTIVPDDYSEASRLFGLYALTRVPFSAGVRRYQAETRAAFEGDLRLPEGASLVRFAPPAAPGVARATLAARMKRWAANPLGIPEPPAPQLPELFAAYAPAFDIEVTGDHDRPGALRWEHAATTPTVDATDPVVYAQLAWTRYRGAVLLQLVYTLWFPERPPQGGFDMLAGKLDGITYRVTLAPDGEPLLYDAMHPCGCYHMFFPTPRARPIAPPDEQQEWMFSPQALPRVAEGERPVLRIATRTHYLERIRLERGADSVVRYALRGYDDLRSLQRTDGVSRASAFGPDGIIAGTERPERFLFWPMGIPSAGAMRQWGRHATAFVGRRHFDDADLLERRFELDL
jgi:hypothetical protein